MLNSVLVPISMEHYPDGAIKRAEYLHEKLNIETYLVYIVEENIFEEVRSRSKNLLNQRERAALESEIIENQKREADVCFNMAKRSTKNRIKECCIIRGLYRDAILKAMEHFKCDLVIIEYISPILARYKILSRSPIPLWVERKEGEINKIGVFNSNLGTSPKVKAIVEFLRVGMDAEVECYFINDPSADWTPKDEVEALTGVDCKIVNENFDNFVYKTVLNHNFDLVIVSRFKDRGMFRDRIEYSKNMKCNVLFLE